MLSVEPWGLKQRSPAQNQRWRPVSVLSVEPWGLKPPAAVVKNGMRLRFSALGRAVGFETQCAQPVRYAKSASVSVLSVEPWGLKHKATTKTMIDYVVSVLSVEPWGLKPRATRPYLLRQARFQCSRSSRGV